MGTAPKPEVAPKVVQLVANDAAGGHKARKVAALAAAFERAGAQVVVTGCGPHSEFAIDPRAAHVCVIGGDGTVRHAVLAADRCGRPVALGIYPAGTINLLHREAPCDLDPDIYAAAMLRSNAARSHHAVSLNDSLFLACASVGPDSAAVAALSPTLKRRIGRLAYGIAFLAILAKWPRHQIILSHDGRALRCEAFYVAKGRFFAGPWSFAPAACGSEPLLHVVALRKVTRIGYARFLWAMLRRAPIDRVPGATCFTCTALAAECATPLPVQADGDVIATLPIAIAIRPEPILFH